MLKSKKTVLSIILGTLIVLCLTLGFLGLNANNISAYASTKHEHNTWAVWGDDDGEKTSLPGTAGDYVLTSDITLSETWSVPTTGTTNLCLNGYVINANCTEDNKFSVIKVGEGATLNLFDCGKTVHNGYVDENGLWHLGEGEGTAKSLTGGIITGGNSSTDGGGINVSGTFNMYGGNIAGNTAQNGGGIYASPLCVVILTGGLIANNTAQIGGGVYCQVEQCFAPGTPITMEDGNQRAIETLEIGESVRVFDHEKGEYSSSKIFDVWKYPEKHSDVVKLHFTNNIDLTVVYGHSFFEHEQNKYVAVTKDNVDSFIGHEFYNVDNSRWETLEEYEFINGEVDTYVITTEYHLNCVANGMLTNEDGFYTMITNIFDYGDDLKIDESKKASDIDQYGIYGFENLKYMSRETYDKLNFQYLNVAIGKGMITTEEISCLGAYWSNVDSELFCDENEKTPSKSGLVLLNSPLKAPLLTSTPAPTAPGVYVGGSVQITDNSANGVASNVYLSSSKTITLCTNENAPTTMSVGVTTKTAPEEDTPIQITTNGTKDNLSNFFSDNSTYYLTFNDSKIKLNAPKENQYAINCISSTNGTISTDVSVAEENTEVTITVTPAESHILKSLTAIYNDGEEKTLDLTAGQNNTFTFVMPAYAVSVTAEFEHYHLFTFAVDGDIITATCVDDCPDGFDDEPIILSLNAENEVFSVDVNHKYCSASATWSNTQLGLPVAVLEYYIDSDTKTTNKNSGATKNEDGSAPAWAGNYIVKATITVNEVPYTIQKAFTIERAGINQVGINLAQPVANETPKSKAYIFPTQVMYSGEISWSPELLTGNKFNYSTVYTATATLTANSNYIFIDGASATTYPIDGWTKSENSTDTKLIYTKTFSATEKCPHDKTLIEGISATFDNDGYLSAYYCEICGLYYSDQFGENLIGDEMAYNAWKTNEGCLLKLKKPLGVGAIVGICIGSLLLILIISYLFGYFFLYRKGKLDEKKIKIIYKFLPRGEENK